MVDFISSWSEQIILAVIIATILEMLLPNGKSKKYVKMVIGIYVLFCIISPFIDTNEVNSSTKFDLENYINTDIKSDKIDQSSMDKRLEELYLQELEKEIIKTVESQGFGVKKCKVEAELFDEKNGGIKKIELSIISKQESISKVEAVEINVGQTTNSVSEDVNDEQIKKLKENLASYYEISQDIIIIN